MSVKSVAALVVAALVAGVILGSLTVAGAGNGGQDAYYGAAASDCSGGDCSLEAASAGGADCAPQAAPAAAPVAPSGACADCVEAPQQ